MGVHRYRSAIQFHESHLRRFCHTRISSLPLVEETAGAHTDRVRIAKLEFQTVGLACVDGILVEDLDVKEPLLQVVCGDQSDTGR